MRGVDDAFVPSLVVAATRPAAASSCRTKAADSAWPMQDATALRQDLVARGFPHHAGAATGIAEVSSRVLISCRRSAAC